MENIEQIARACHTANRALQFSFEDPNPSPVWEDAPEWQREATFDSVRKILDGSGPEELHAHWVADKVAHGWTYGTVKDFDAKTHPCLVPYAELPREELLKDRVFVDIVREMSA